MGLSHAPNLFVGKKASIISIPQVSILMLFIFKADLDAFIVARGTEKIVINNDGK